MPDYREERIWSCLLTIEIVASFIKLSVVTGVCMIKGSGVYQRLQRREPGNLWKRICSS